MVELVTVTEDEAEIRLDRWLRRHFPGLPQSAIQKLCRGGQVRVDGHRADAATRLMAGQAVRVPPLPLASPAAAKPAGEIDPGLADAASAEHAGDHGRHQHAREADQDRKRHQSLSCPMPAYTGTKID